MVVYGEGRYRCPAHGDVRPAPAPVADLDAGRFEPRCPTCGRPSAPALIDETAPLDPRNVYAATKLHTEHLCQAFEREAGVPVTLALRYHNVYGPRMPRDTPYAGVASIFRSAAGHGSTPRRCSRTAASGGTSCTSPTWPAPTCWPSTVEPAPRARSTCASGEPHTVGDLASTLAEACSTGARPLVTGDYRLGDVRHVVASPAARRRELGFRAAVGFTEGVTAFARAPLRSSAP